MSSGTDTHTHTHTHTHIPTCEPKQFQETMHAQACGPHTSGLKVVSKNLIGQTDLVQSNDQSKLGHNLISVLVVTIQSPYNFS